MFSPRIIIPNNALILQSALYINFSSYYFVFILILPAQFYDFDAIDVSVSTISYFIYFSLSSLAYHRNLFKILFVPFILDNGKVKDTLPFEYVILLIKFYELFVVCVFVFLDGCGVELFIVNQLLSPIKIFFHLISD